MRTRRSQMKMGETIMVLVVFFIMVMVGLVVYSNMRASSIEKKMAEKAKTQSITLSVTATQLPELLCTDTMCINCDGAIDLLKLRAVSQNCQKTPDENNEGCQDFSPDSANVFTKYRIGYAKIFGTSTLKVDVISSVSDEAAGVETYTVYDAKGKKTSSLSPYFIPVNVYDAQEDQCLMGIMEVQTWS
jgi:hypothetical protein